MIALYIPMQPSSKTPMIAWSRLQLLAERDAARAVLGVVRRRTSGPRSPGRGSCRGRSGPLVEPLPEPSAREAVLEVLAPDRAVRDARLRQRRVDVQHARRDPATRRSSWRASGSGRGASSAPRGRGSCTPTPPRRRRAARRDRSCGRSGCPRACPSMKPCFLSGSYGWPRTIRAPSSPKAFVDGLLERLLRGPAALVRGEARVAARDEDDVSTGARSRCRAHALTRSFRTTTLAEKGFSPDDGGILCRDAQRGRAAGVGGAAAGAAGPGVPTGFVRLPAG